MSVTLRHHQPARGVFKNVEPSSAAAVPPANSPRRDSSGESHLTAPSDPRGWFDQSNRNPPVNDFEATAMDVDPPFFQKETDSSNGGARGPRVDPAYPFGPGARQVLMRPTVTHSSSADDYRSVIDDLTIENKRLKEELKRYKQFGPDMMQKEKLFEIKVHGLPKRKKRELEATLRDFAASLEGSSESPPQRKKQGRHGKNMYSSGGSMSKHASSSSSRSRPVDSAYASMSTGPSSNAPNSSKASLGRPSMANRARTSEQKVEDYLRDTPGGLFPRPDELTDKERKKLVVRRLEQLFTGKIGGKVGQRTLPLASAEAKNTSDTALAMAPPSTLEAAREARIQPNDPTRKKLRSGDNLSTSNSNGDQTESGGNGQESGGGGGGGSGGGSGGRTGNNTSPPSAPLPEQRPTRPRDLDPDRVQVPSENMEYIRHLGLVAPELLVDGQLSQQKVSPDAEGWVYLNLLCNLAQLHMLNVTPNFIRLAVTEKSTKFQLSPDGRKIRWRGGTDGTKFSSDSSGDNSQKSPSTGDTDGPNGSGQRKRSKLQATGGGTKSSTSTLERKSGAQVSASSDSFHYKPMFVQQSSSVETSLEGTGSQGSDGVLDDSNLGNSKWEYSGSGSSQRKRRRHDGAIVYYSGAPFCIDLSGDPGDVSPTTYMTSTGQELESVEDAGRFAFYRTLSGSSLPIRPISDPQEIVGEVLDLDLDASTDLFDSDDTTQNEEDADFPWCDNPGKLQPAPEGPPLEPCGLGGVLPEDHFLVIVDTRRIIGRGTQTSSHRRSRSVESAEAIVNRLSKMSTSSPRPPRGVASLDKPIEIEYLRGSIKRLRPHPLPPPAIFIPPFSTDSETDGSEDELDSEDERDCQGRLISGSLISRRANPHPSKDGVVIGDSFLGDEEVELGGTREDAGVEESDSSIKSLQPQVAQSAATGRRSKSSVATRGAKSGYSSSVEEDE
ncbi:hypothetical protein OQA88_9845 [Cercophora sp. LCS_1]